MEKISGGIAVDDRGSVSFVNRFDFAEVKRFYQVKNHRRGFVRSWHGHLQETKWVWVAKGTIKVGVCKLNKTGGIDSPEGFILSEHNPVLLKIPPGYANGFQTLTEDAVVIFYSSSSVEESSNDDLRLSYQIHADFWKEDFR